MNYEDLDPAKCKGEQRKVRGREEERKIFGKVTDAEIYAGQKDVGTTYGVNVKTGLSLGPSNISTFTSFAQFVRISKRCRARSLQKEQFICRYLLIFRGYQTSRETFQR